MRSVFLRKFVVFAGSLIVFFFALPSAHSASRVDFAFVIKNLCRDLAWPITQPQKSCTQFAKKRGYLKGIRSQKFLARTDLEKLLEKIKRQKNDIPPNRFIIASGDSITLSNNLTIDFHEVLLKNKWNPSVAVTHRIGSHQLNLFPTTHNFNLNVQNPAMWNEDFGYRIEFLSYLDHGHFLVSLTPLAGSLVTPKDLYDDCFRLQQSHEKCFKYSLFEPLPHETKVQTDNFLLLGPAENADFLDAVGKRLEESYKKASIFLGGEKKISRIPVHFIKNSPVLMVSNFGLQLALGIPSEESALHEMAHLTVQGSRLSEILNEGLATYTSYQFFNPDNFTCGEKSYSLKGVEKNYQPLYLYGAIPYHEGGSELYYPAACFWEIFVKEFGREKFLKAIQVILQDRESSLSQKISTLELLESSLDINLDHLRKQFQFQPSLSDGRTAYERSVEHYVPFGGSAAMRWDGNYKNERP